MGFVEVENDLSCRALRDQLSCKQFSQKDVLVRVDVRLSVLDSLPLHLEILYQDCPQSGGRDAESKVLGDLFLEARYGEKSFFAGDLFSD